MRHTKKITATILALLFCVLQGCVSPGALKADIQGIRADMNSLEKVADELSLWKSNVEAETINYGGGGWIVLGTGVIVFIFVGAGFLLIRAFIKRSSSLSLLTCAIQKVGKYSPASVINIKAQLKREVKEGQFKEKDRQNLGHFAKKRGTFTKQK